MFAIVSGMPLIAALLGNRALIDVLGNGNKKRWLLGRQILQANF